MNKKILNFINTHKIAIILALILGILPNIMVKDYSKEFNELNLKVNNLEKNIASLKNNDKSYMLKEEIYKLQEENDSLNKELKEKQKE